MTLSRTIEQWKRCKPAIEQSEAAVAHTVEDAQHDILELHAALQKAQRILKKIAYPCRGTEDEWMSVQDFAERIQATFTLEQLEGDGHEADR